MNKGRIRTARVCVLTIIREEFEALQDALKATDEVPPLTGYYTPDARSCDVVIGQSADRGNVPAVGATNDLLERFRPEVFIVVGIAGGIMGRDGIEPGDVVVADNVHYSEYMKMVSGRRLRRYAAYDQPSVGLRQRHAETVIRDNRWQDAIAVRPPADVRPKALVGSIVAGEKVLGDPKAEAQHYVANEYDNALAVDMESYGVGRAVHEARSEVDYNPGLLIIRGISDTVAVDEDAGNAGPDAADGERGQPLPGERRAAEAVDNNAQRQEWKPFAAASAGAFAAEVVARICSVEDIRAEFRAVERANA